MLIQIPGRAVLVGWPPPGWVVVACDVGQGDALVLNAGPGSAVVVDAGPDPVPVDRCLRELGVSRIPVLVLSHDHLDHVGGLSGVLHQRQVDRVLSSPLSEPGSAQRLVLSVLGSRQLRPEAVGAGQRIDAGQSQLDVLGPSHVFLGSRSDPNNTSVVLRATVAGVRILLPGDAEIEAQDDLLSSGVDLRADILKVPHHGSAYSDPAFLQAAHARLALISVGVDNDYGHPSPLLLAELATAGGAGGPHRPAGRHRGGEPGRSASAGRRAPPGRLAELDLAAASTSNVGDERAGAVSAERWRIRRSRTEATAERRRRPWPGRSPRWPGCPGSARAPFGITTRSGCCRRRTSAPTATATTSRPSCCGCSRSCCCASWAWGWPRSRDPRSQLDPVQALREHRQRLLRERDRLGVLARTVARTIDRLQAEGQPR